jgi:hypothetical protein
VPWNPPDPWSYSYLLGAYLGDGYVSGAGQLLIVCDEQYPEIIEDTRCAIILTSQRRHIGVHPHRKQRYVRLTNMSADIRGLFCATCEQVNVRWTQSNHRNISVSHRRSVALLDEHVGPKS